MITINSLGIYFIYINLTTNKILINIINIINMIIIIRGHIRNSFETKELYNFIETIYNFFPDLKIFIHTWNVFSNNISWREININNNIVNEEIIHNYFDKLSKCIKHIIIDDDANIKLIGNVCGNINNGLTPIVGWKNYWYGKYRIINYIYNKNINNNFNMNDEIIINTRFDIMNNSNNFSQDLLINFIKNNFETNFTKNVFLFDYEFYGIDNIYIGNINTMHKLTNKFNCDLDNILMNNSGVKNQEFLVYRINSSLFD
jgi:hypothetical protein